MARAVGWRWVWSGRGERAGLTGAMQLALMPVPARSAERPLTITVDSDIVGNIAEIALERFRGRILICRTMMRGPSPVAVNR